MPVQNTSIISYYIILEELGFRQIEVLKCLKKLNVANNKMILEEMRKTYPKMDISSICGRMKELRELKIVRLNHTGICPFTSEQTKFYSIVSYVEGILQ